MKRVLVAQRDRPFAEALERVLQTAGYGVLLCPGPWPPTRRCIRCDVGYCPLTEGADALIYDPSLVALAIWSAREHPDLPLVLTWPEEGEPSGVAAIQRRVPWAAVASDGLNDLLTRLDALLAER